MPVTPLPENTIIEITIEPWAVKSSSGSFLSSTLIGMWLTKLNPLYSSVYAVETEAGKLLSNFPDSLIVRAIFEASRYVDGLKILTCENPNTAYFAQARWRYVTLKAIMSIRNSLQGMSNVKRKLLGDFEIEFDARDGDGNPFSRLLDELARLEPVVLSGGCLGLGTSNMAQIASKGALDPYRPIFSRTLIEPIPGEQGVIQGSYSPRVAPRYQSDRFFRATHSIIRKPR